MGYRTGWRPLLGWAIAFGLTTLALITGASIGIFVWPFAITALAVATRRNRPWPESLFGGLLGVASICLLVAYLNRAYSPCPPPSSNVMRFGAGEHFRCGGLDPRPWLMVGLVLAVAGLIGYLAFKHTDPGAAT